MPAGSTTPDTACPVDHCGRDMRPGDIVCRRCWYVAPADVKDNFRDALQLLRKAKTGRNIQALLAAKTRVINSINPKGTSS